MKKPCKVLFISAPIGAGHTRAAQAIQAGLQQKYPSEVEATIVNVFDFFHPCIGQGILRIYMQILKIFPQLYGVIYGWGNNSKTALAGRELVSGFLAWRMYKFINEHNPDIIVCTHATPAGLTAHLIRKGRLKIPVVAVITDYVVHSLWIYPEIQHYIVANDLLREKLLKRGIGREAIHSLGIPVDNKFSLPIDRNAIFKKLALDPHCNTVLLMGGGAGLLPMDKILLSCKTIEYPLQIIIVTGHNKKLYRQLTQLSSGISCKVHIMEYVSNIHELMAVSQLIITKPGGMTCAEALSLGLPMIIYRPIPGQEEANAKQLLRLGAAEQADSIQRLQEILKELLVTNPGKLALLKKCAQAYGNPRAGLDIAQYILSKI